MHISKWPKADTKWYLGVRCRKCQTPILFALDQSDGTQKFAGIGKLILTCPETVCRHQADYSLARVTRFQKTVQTKSPETSKQTKR